MCTISSSSDCTCSSLRGILCLQYSQLLSLCLHLKPRWSEMSFLITLSLHFPRGHGTSKNGHTLRWSWDTWRRTGSREPFIIINHSFSLLENIINWLETNSTLFQSVRQTTLFQLETKYSISICQRLTLLYFHKLDWLLYSERRLESRLTLIHLKWFETRPTLLYLNWLETRPTLLILVETSFWMFIYAVLL